MLDVFRGSSGTSRTQRRLKLPSDLPELFDGLRTVLTSNPPTNRSSPPSTNASIQLGRCTLDQGIWPTTPYGLSCGSTSMRRVNPRMFHPNSPDQPSGTRAPALTPTSRISSKSATARTKTFSSLICIASARRLLQPTYNGLRTQCYTFRGRRGARPTPLSPLVNSGWKRIGVPSL